MLSALEHWERSDLPRSPAAWLLKAARRKAIDRIRRDRGFAAKLLELAYLYELENNSDDAEDNAVIPDERLQIILANWLLHQRLRIDQKARTRLINGDHQTVTLGAHMPTVG